MLASGRLTSVASLTPQGDRILKNNADLAAKIIYINQLLGHTKGEYPRTVDLEVT